MRQNSLLPGNMLACFAAGPIFVASSTLAMLHARLPKPIEVDVEQLLLFLPILLAAAVFGAFMAAIPVLVGAAGMRFLAEFVPLARAPSVWTGVGALAGAGIALATGAMRQDPVTAFGLIVTSALCARICRFQLRSD